MAGIRETIRANLLTLLAFFAFGLQATSAPLWLTILVPNTAIALALCSYYAGLRRLLGLGVPRHLMTLGCLLALLVLVVYTYVEWRIGPRIAAMSLLQMGFMLAIARSIHRNMPAHRSRYSYRFVWAVAMISAAVCALRAGVYLQDASIAQPLLEPTAWNIVFLTLGMLIMPCLSLGTIMIIHDRMLADREQELNTDFLTGLMSRKAWWMQAERYCAQALRTRRPLTLLLLDIDHFKRINDLHGHAAGDAVLRHFGLLATATLRTGDHVGRVGGEEFGVLFPDLRSDAVMDVAARLLDSVRRTPCAHGGSTISYTFSAGVVDWMPGENFQNFFERADRKLYAAKAAGRNRIIGPAEQPEAVAPPAPTAAPTATATPTPTAITA